MLTTLSVVFASVLATLVNAAGPRTKCVETYRATDTDTCASISAWSLIPVSSIESMNPGISCSAPMNVQTVCLQLFKPTCTLNSTAWETTCNDMAGHYNLTVSDFVLLNDNVDTVCDDLVIGDSYCVSTADCYPGNDDPLCSGHEG